MERDPVLSIVVAVVSDTLHSADTDHLRPCLHSLRQQVDPPPFEVIVPHYPHLAGIAELRREFPEIRFLDIPDLQRYAAGVSREHHNELRARGVAAARGEIVALMEDHGVADPHWSARIVTAHRASVAGVGGAIDNGIDRILNWAVYFCDFGQYGNPVGLVETFALSDANVSYKRSALESIRPVWRDVFHEGAINYALQTRGERLLLSPDLIVHQNRLHLNLRNALAERWVWGRSYGADRNLAGLSRWIWAGLSPAIPALILARLSANVLLGKRHLGPFCRAFPVTAILVVAWCLGEMTAYLRGDKKSRWPSSSSVPATFPQNPRLSVVIVRTVDTWDAPDTSGLAATLDALQFQTIGCPFEIIVPSVAMARTSQWCERYPSVFFLAAEPAAPPRSAERLDELRAIGVAAARGDIIAVIEDHVRPDTDWSARILEAHRAPYAAIGGAIENGTSCLLNWAAYFADLGRYHNPVPAGDSGYASVVNVSYKRSALESIRHVWHQRFSETAVHTALMAGGEKLALSGAVIVKQYRDNITFGSCCRDFLTWGRSYGSTRARLAGPARRLVYACLSPLVPAILLLRTAADVVKKRRLLPAWLKSLPVAAALTIAWSLGELTGYLAGEAAGAIPEPRMRQTHAGD